MLILKRAKQPHSGFEKLESSVKTWLLIKLFNISLKELALLEYNSFDLTKTYRIVCGSVSQTIF